KVFLILVILLLSLNTVCYAKRKALVIGNSRYKGIPLKNPVNDANDIASTLRELDFDVTERTNLNKRELIEIANDFENRITSNDVVLFYFSGHGVQVDGINYLIPVDADINKEEDIEFEAVSLNRVIGCIEKSRMNIIILDACRDNPFKNFRSLDRGLAQITSKTDGTFIAYSTAPGTVARDGSGRNSPYTKNLISKMKTDMNIEKVFKEVRKSVKKETNNRQIPWDSSSLTDDFYFCMSCAPQTTEPKYEPKIEQKQKTYDNMVFVQGGTFQMGSNNGNDDEEPIHSVTVSDFYIGKYEVTNAEYIEFLNAKGVSSNGSYGGTEYIDMDDEDCAVGYRNGRFYFRGSSYAEDKNCPVIEVTWFGAKAYCKWKGGRLPSEAEWEYAARGGNKRRSVSLSGVEDYKYSGSNNIGSVAWYDGNSDNKTHPVGTKQPNELGIYDMSGNVWEWCNDWYGKYYYQNSPKNNPQGPNSGEYSVLRGGSWSYNDYGCRVADRGRYDRDAGDYDFGFRFARTP
ncbi:MAG TPA: hypothetical protein ENK92_02065, partial [Bacteroidetes bacterium]|nr:hypothetical protein [Bacteroidota bacterium]